MNVILNAESYMKCTVLEHITASQTKKLMQRY